MLKPVIQKIKSKYTPWEIFQNVYKAEDVCVFLDSVRYQTPDQNYSYIALRPFLEMEIPVNQDGSKGALIISGAEKKKTKSKDVFKEMRRLLKKSRSQFRYQPPYFSGGALGYWGYEMVGLFEKISFRKKKTSRIPLFYQGFFTDVIVYDHKQKVYLLVTHVKSDSKRESARAMQRLAALKLFFGNKPAALKSLNQAIQFEPEISKNKFIQIVEKSKKYIEAGDIYQANLSQRFRLHFPGPKLKLYDYLREINPSPFASFLKIRDVEIISSSPERLVSKRGLNCETRPIAGTRALRQKNKGLAQIKRELLGNDKERAEHIMLVDLERNDLGRVCEWRSVKVSEMMILEKYSHVVHIVSKIVGCLKPKFDALDLFQAMFPGGTITGCPKVRCMEVIDELEPSERGLYTGSIGYIDFAGNMDLNIVIRTLVFKGQAGHLQVGAGIVYDSEPFKEYEETLHKGEALVEAVMCSGAV